MHREPKRQTAIREKRTTYISDLPCRHHGPKPSRFAKSNICLLCQERSTAMYTQRPTREHHKRTVYHGEKRQVMERQWAMELAHEQIAAGYNAPMRYVDMLWPMFGVTRAYRVHRLYIAWYKAAQRAVELGLADLL